MARIFPASGGGGVGSGDVATDTIWNTKGDLAVGTGSDTAARLPVGVPGQALRPNPFTTTGLEWVDSLVGGLAWFWKLDGSLTPGDNDQFQQIARLAGIVVGTKNDEDEIDSIVEGGTRTATLTFTAGQTVLTGQPANSFEAADKNRLLVNDQYFLPGTYIISRDSSTGITINQGAIQDGTSVVVKLADSTSPYRGKVYQYCLAGELKNASSNNPMFGDPLNDAFVAANPNLFLYSGAARGTLASVVSTSGNYFADLGSTTYRQWFVDRFNNAVTGYWNVTTAGKTGLARFDGLFLDNIPMSYQVYTKNGSAHPQNNAGTLYNADTWRAAVYGFLDYLRTNLITPAAKEMWANVIERPNPSTQTVNTLGGLISSDTAGTSIVGLAGETNYSTTRGAWYRGVFDRLDGAMLEYFGTSADTVADPQTQSEVLDWCWRMPQYLINDLGKPCIMVARASDPTDSMRRIGLGHYLLYAKSNTYFRYADDAVGYSDLLWADDTHDLHRLGEPLGKCYVKDRTNNWIWRRDFRNGYVEVDHASSGKPIIVIRERVLKRYQSLKWDYSAPTDGVTDAGPTIQRAINECSADGRELVIDSLRNGRFITNQELTTLRAEVVSGEIIGQKIRIVGNEGHITHGENGLYSDDSLHGSVIQAGPSFPLGGTVLDILAGGWGTVVEGFAIDGSSRAARCLRQGSGWTKVRDMMYANIRLSAGHSDGDGNWCHLVKPDETLVSSIMVGRGNDGPNEGFLQWMAEGLRCTTNYQDTTASFAGAIGGFAVRHGGTEYPTDGVADEMFFNTMKNTFSGGEAYGASFRHCGGTTISRMHPSAAKNNSGVNSSAIGIELAANALSARQLYLDTQAWTFGTSGDGGAFCRIDGNEINVEDVRVLYPGSSPTIEAGFALFAIKNTCYGVTIRMVKIRNDGTGNPRVPLSGSDLPDYLCRLIGGAPAAGTNAGEDFMVLVDDVQSYGVPWDNAGTTIPYGIHDNPGTTSHTGDIYAGMTTWNSGKSKFRWRDVLCNFD